jgi:hypothetical protein
MKWLEKLVDIQTGISRTKLNRTILEVFDVTFLNNSLFLSIIFDKVKLFWSLGIGVHTSKSKPISVSSFAQNIG